MTTEDAQASALSLSTGSAPSSSAGNLGIGGPPALRDSRRIVSHGAPPRERGARNPAQEAGTLCLHQEGQLELSDLEACTVDEPRSIGDIQLAPGFGYLSDGQAAGPASEVSFPSLLFSNAENPTRNAEPIPGPPLLLFCRVEAVVPMGEQPQPRYQHPGFIEGESNILDRSSTELSDSTDGDISHLSLPPAVIPVTPSLGGVSELSQATNEDELEPPGASSTFPQQQTQAFPTVTTDDLNIHPNDTPSTAIEPLPETFELEMTARELEALERKDIDMHQARIPELRNVSSCLLYDVWKHQLTDDRLEEFLSDTESSGKTRTRFAMGAVLSLTRYFKILAKLNSLDIGSIVGDSYRASLITSEGIAYIERFTETALKPNSDTIAEIKAKLFKEHLEHMRRGDYGAQIGDRGFDGVEKKSKGEHSHFGPQVLYRTGRK